MCIFRAWDLIFALRDVDTPARFVHPTGVTDDVYP